MASNQINNLGEAVGVIRIDVSSLQQAQQVVAQFAQATMAALAPVAETLNNLAAISKASTAVYTQQLKLQATETEAAAEVEMAAIKARASADADATKIAIQQSKERISQMNAEAGEAEATAQQTAKAQGSLTSPGARGLSRAAFSAGFALSAVGLQGPAQAAFGVGGIVAVIGEIPLFMNQLNDLTTSLQGAGGVVGQLATAGAAMAGSFGAILAVAAPIIAIGAVVLVLVSALNNLNTAFQESVTKANAYIDKQQQLNTLILGGATSQDLQQQAQKPQTDFEAARAQLDKLAPFMDMIKALPQFDRGAVTVGAQGGLTGAVALAAQRPSKEIQDINQKISEATGGQITSASALIVEYQRLTDIMSQATTGVKQVSDSLGDAGVHLNDLNAANNAAAQGAVDNAIATRQLSQLSSQQLQQRLGDNRAEADAIQQNAALYTGKELEAATQRIQHLDDELAIIQQMSVIASIKETFQQLFEFVGKFLNLTNSFNLTGSRTAEDRSIAATNKTFDNIVQQSRSAEDFTRQRAQENADFQKSEDRSLQDFNANKLKEQAQYNADTLQRQQDLQTKLAQIMSDSRLKILQSAANLDARGVYQEQQRRDQQLKDANTQYQQDTEQRQKVYQQQLDDQQAQFDLQRQRARDDFNERINQEDQQRSLQQSRQAQDNALQQYRQQQQYALMDARRVADMQAQVAQLVGHYLNLQNIARVGLAGLESLFQGVFGAAASTSTPTFKPNVSNLQEGAQYNVGDTYQASGGQIYVWTGSTWQKAYTRDSGGNGVAGMPYLIGTGAQPEVFMPQTNGTFIPKGDMGGTVNLNGDIVLGDIGNRTDDEVLQLMERGFRQLVGKGMQRLAGTS